MADNEHRGLSAVGIFLMAFSAIAVLVTVGVGITNQDEPTPHDTVPTPSATSSPSPSASPASPEAFVSANGQDLSLEGNPFRYAGTNAYTLMFEAPATIDVNMQVAEDEDMSVVRTWAFFDKGTLDDQLGVEIDTRHIYFQYWDPVAGAPAFNDGETGLEHMDQVIASAQKHGLKLILPLVNNWTAFGGIDQYVRWADGTYHDDFFTDAKMKQWYKDWVSHIVNRVNTITGVAYKDDPTIMAWELGNELQCSDSGPYPSSPNCGSDVMVSWADEMSTYLRSQDPNHLIGFGGEGFMCTDPGGSDWLTNCTKSADPVALLALDNINIHGIHVYPNHWEPTEPTSDWQEWGAWWIDQQGTIAANANKPYYIGEYGWVEQSSRMLVFDDWLQHFYDAGGDGSHFWVMQPASSIGAPPDSVGFTQRCPGPACDLVGNWSRHVGQGVEWSEFGPIAENDFAFQSLDGTATVDVLANDKVYGPATFDLTSIDLDPDSAGVQTSLVTDHGTLTVADGTVTFVSSADAGSATVKYTVADSEGRAALPRSLTIVPKSS